MCELLNCKMANEMVNVVIALKDCFIQRVYEFNRIVVEKMEKGSNIILVTEGEKLPISGVIDDIFLKSYISKQAIGIEIHFKPEGLNLDKMSSLILENPNWEKIKKEEK